MVTGLGVGVGVAAAPQAVRTNAAINMTLIRDKIFLDIFFSLLESFISDYYLTLKSASLILLNDHLL
jgi:hypothetical protein